MKLKSCPLCNGMAEQEEWLTKCEDDNYLKYATIVCKRCGLTLFGCKHEEYDHIEKDEIQALADLWNTRTPKERGEEK